MMKKILSILSLLFLFGCEPMIDVHGNKLSNEEMDKKLSSLKPGVTSFEEVKKIMGTPVAVTSFDSEKWFYIYSSSKRQSFYEPTEIDRSSIMINFDNDGIFQSYELKTMADGKTIKPDADSTPLNANELSFYEQLTESIGKFGTNQPVY